MPKTFGSKLRRMRIDLASIVDRMNRDRSIEAAMLAQQAVVAIDALETQMEELGFDVTEWDLEPEEERHDG